MMDNKFILPGAGFSHLRWVASIFGRATETGPNLKPDKLMPNLPADK